jgi:hypothetical protein
MCYHVSGRFRSHLTIEVGSNTVTCLTVPDLTSLLK